VSVHSVLPLSHVCPYTPLLPHAFRRTSEVLCENNINILRLLSEDVFDFSKHTMTVARATSLKTSLRDQFEDIFRLILFILEASTKASLIEATLRCLQRYVTWIPEPFIFETPLLERLVMGFLPTPEFRVPCLQVLSEVCTLTNSEYDSVFELLFMTTMGQIVKIVPPDVNIAEAYAAATAAGDEASTHFVNTLANFLTSFFRSHAPVLEQEQYRDALLSGMNYLVGISDVPERETFKVCAEYWLTLSEDLYRAEMRYDPRLPSLSDDGTPLPTGSAGNMASLGLTTGMAALGFGGASGGGGGGGSGGPRKALYAEVLVRVRELMIRHMAKPEEVLIEKDDTGEYVRELQKDTDNAALYKVMRDAMVFLTHLDPKNMEALMLDKLSREAKNPDWSFDALNTLCWAIGSISGTMSELDEKALLVTIIKDLLVMCEEVKGKSKKAVIASNIMYVVGQYPRFLRAHWRFLRTVVLKLFEFMHEKHPGVQDMAVDTFLKITSKCKKKFVQLQTGESMTFVEEACNMLPAVITDLESHQINGFYEALGNMVSAHPDPTAQELLTDRLMVVPNTMWGRLMAAAADNIDTLKNPDTLRDLGRVLRINAAACRSIGTHFAKQLGRLYLDMLNVYKAVSGMLITAVEGSGAGVLATATAKVMLSVKRDVLTLVETYVARAADPAFVAVHFIPPLLDPVLDDYAACQPAAREAGVLRLMAEVVERLKRECAEFAPRMLNVAFGVALPMITADPNAMPDHRLEFFRLLRAVNLHCFPALFAMADEHQKVIVDAAMWAVKHVDPDIGELGLSILQDMVQNFSMAGAELAQGFYGMYLLPLLRDLLGVLTDRLHKAHLRWHATILRQLLGLVLAGVIAAPLWQSAPAVEGGYAAAFEAHCVATAPSLGVDASQLATNEGFVREYIRSLVADAFSNLSA